MMSQAMEYGVDAQQALARAEAEARALGHGYIGQEHLLIALWHVEEGPVAAVRAQFGLSPERLRDAIKALVMAGSGQASSDLSYTPRLAQALRFAADEAKGAGQAPIAAIHLLCGLILEGTGVGAGVLQSLGVTIEHVRETYRPLPFGVAAMQAAMTAELVEQDRGIKRYLFAMPMTLYQEVQELADRQHTNVADLLRRFTRLGLLAARLQDSPNASLIIRDGATEQRILLL
jgi:ATP-dependent Clp protease ATP-binding subunit ClpC